MATATSPVVAAAVVVGPSRPSSTARATRVKYINGLNSFGGLKAHSHVASLGLHAGSEQCFAKIVSSLKQQSSSRKSGAGGALTSTCNVVTEIFPIAAITSGITLVGVAIGFLEAAVEEANSSDILYEILPYIKVYKNGTIERLKGTETTPPSLNPNSDVLSKDIIIQPSLNVSARLFLPTTAAAGTRKLPLLVYFHGGAFCTSSPFSTSYHNYMNSVVAKADVVAVSVNYRLAPEHHLPAAYHDSWLALKWVFSHSKTGKGEGEDPWLRRYVDFERVYLAGDSAGGNIAHNTAVRAGLDPGVAIHGLFLSCPHFWGKTRIGDEASFPKEQLETEEKIWIYAYPNSSGFDDPLLNPNFNPNLGKLDCKKVLVYVAENDVLKDRGLDYVKALEKTKWDGVAESVEVKGADHCFNLNFPDSTDAEKMLNHFALFLNGN